MTIFLDKKRKINEEIQKAEGFGDRDKRNEGCSIRT